jgi:hypothetical protein
MRSSIHCIYRRACADWANSLVRRQLSISCASVLSTQCLALLVFAAIDAFRIATRRGRVVMSGAPMNELATSRRESRSTMKGTQMIALALIAAALGGCAASLGTNTAAPSADGLASPMTSPAPCLATSSCRHRGLTITDRVGPEEVVASLPNRRACEELFFGRLFLPGAGADTRSCRRCRDSGSSPGPGRDQR